MTTILKYLLTLSQTAAQHLVTLWYNYTHRGKFEPGYGTAPSDVMAPLRALQCI
jgi:hypothetical protein